MKKTGRKVIAYNRKARHEYFVVETYEAGVELVGTEVKSLRNGMANLKDGFCYIEEGELFLHNVHISPYEQGNIFNCDPIRKRKLLMHKGEIKKLFSLVKAQGYSLIPLSLYFKHAHVKVEVALCKGKKQYDKRETAAKRDAQREIERTVKNRFYF